MPDSNTNQINTKTIRQLWHNWALCFGCPALVTGASLIIPPLWLPLVAFGLGYILLLLHRHAVGTTDRSARCSLVQWLTMFAMFGSAIIMTVINIVYSPKVIPCVVAENPELPFITSLVVYPMMCAVAIYGLYVGQESSCCERCQSVHGYYHGAGHVSMFYYNAARNQLHWLLLLSAGISVVDTVYFFTSYINVNLNNPDRFFFIALPATLYVLSLGYMIKKYHRLYLGALAYNHEAEKSRRHGIDNLNAGATLVRFLPVCGDYLLLCPNSEQLWDTPWQVVKPFTDKITHQEAQSMIDEKTAGQNIRFKLKYIFSNDGYVAGCNVLHYACILDEDQLDTVLPNCERCTLDTLQRMLRGYMLSPYIINELYRIHTVTMAWKTYHADGRRMYPIKNYRPTFRLRDFKDWDVDYNDLAWLRVARNNQDRPFWQLRRWVDRYLLFGKK